MNRTQVEEIRKSTTDYIRTATAKFDQADAAEDELIDRHKPELQAWQEKMILAGALGMIAATPYLLTGEAPKPDEWISLPAKIPVNYGGPLIVPLQEDKDSLTVTFKDHNHRHQDNTFCVYNFPIYHTDNEDVERMIGEALDELPELLPALHLRRKAGDECAHWKMMIHGHKLLENLLADMLGEEHPHFQEEERQLGSFAQMLAQFGIDPSTEG